MGTVMGDRMRRFRIGLEYFNQATSTLPHLVISLAIGVRGNATVSAEPSPRGRIKTLKESSKMMRTFDNDYS
jgi:hypothetical protein